MASETFVFDWTLLGNQLGVFVKNSNLFDTQVASWETKKVEADAGFDNSDDERFQRDAILRRINSIISVLISNQAGNTTEATTYITGLMRAIIGSSFSSLSDVLDDLIQKMTDESQTFLENIVGMQPSEWSEINDGTDQLSGYDKIRGMKEANLDSSLKLYITIVDDTGGFFHVEGFNNAAKAGGDKIFDSATYNSIGTTVLTEANSSGIAGLLDILVVGPIDADIELTFSFNNTIEGSGSITLWSANQMARQLDDLRIECKVASTSGAELWDIIGRLSGRNKEQATTGIAFPPTGKKDTSGMDFKIVADTTFAKSGDAGGLLQESSFVNLTDVNRADVDASRKLYITITESTGDHTIKGFSDSGLTNQVLESAIYTAIGTVAISEKNSSGIGGTLEVLVLGTDLTIDVVMALRFRVGDTFNTRLDSDNAGKFISFFRDFFNIAPPTAASGAETIPDP